jgi:deoxyadenosine/deoxycytidine kinase
MSIQKPQIIFIEGNIGAGKTTFLKLIENSKYFLNKYPNKKIAYIYEPVNEWLEYKDKSGIDILTYFYKDQEKYGFSFQWYVFMTRIKAINNVIESGAEILFVERSIFTDKNVFMKSLYQKEKITDMEYHIYMDWFNWIANKMFKYSYKFIYMQLSTDECYKRILKRNRDSESVIEYDYLELINNNHDNWLSILPNEECIILSSDYSIDDNNIISIYLQKIENMINTYLSSA